MRSLFPPGRPTKAASIYEKEIRRAQADRKEALRPTTQGRCSLCGSTSYCQVEGSTTQAPEPLPGCPRYVVRGGLAQAR